MLELNVQLIISFSKAKDLFRRENPTQNNLKIDFQIHKRENIFDLKFLTDLLLSIYFIFFFKCVKKL